MKRKKTLIDITIKEEIRKEEKWITVRSSLIFINLNQVSSDLLQKFKISCDKNNKYVLKLIHH